MFLQVYLGKNAPSDKINIGQIGFGRIAMTHDLAETLKYDVARIVAVADFDHWHAQPAIEAALAGKDIYVQKPNSLTIKEGQLLLRLVYLAILQVRKQQKCPYQKT